MYDPSRSLFAQLMLKIPPPLRDLTQAFAQRAGVPLPMAFGLVLSAIATATQRTRAIQLPDGTLETLHRIDLICAEPESGKDTAYRAVFAPLIDFNKSIGAVLATEPGEGEEYPTRALLLNSNESADLAEVITGHAQSTTVVLVDGGALFASPLVKRDKYRLCELWDGQKLGSMRDKKSKLRTISSPAVSILAMPQTEPLSNYMSTHGKDAYRTGLLQRCSITFPSSCYDYVSVDARCIDEFALDIQEYLGDPAAFARGDVPEIQGVPLSPAASRWYQQMLHEQTQARMSGAPPPWRALQKALRTSLVIQLSIPHRAGDHRLSAVAGGSSGVAEISLESFEAARAYVDWQHSQPEMLQLRGLVAAPPPAKSALSMPTFKRSPTEKRRLQTLEDADEIMRKLEEYASRHGSLHGVPVRALKHRVGLYSARYEKALARLVDEGYVVLEKCTLTRTLRHYRYSTAFPFAGCGVLGEI